MTLQPDEVIPQGGEAVAHEDHEAVTGPDGGGVLLCQCDHGRVVDLGKFPLTSQAARGSFGRQDIGRKELPT